MKTLKYYTKTLITLPYYDRKYCLSKEFHKFNNVIV